MQIERRRRQPEKKYYGLLGRRISRRATLVTACITTAALATGTAVADTRQFGTDQVGQVTGRGRVVSADQYIAPYGDRLVIDDGKIMSSA
ncbi:phosphoesterase, partial [Streptomyces sp. SID625]|nr:phosphoesterase [Streptomyces sp. SID625]